MLTLDLEMNVIESAELPDITFDTGLPGFPSARRFVCVRWGGDDSPFSLLQSLDQPLEFLVVPPDIFFGEYEVEIDDETVAALDLRDATEALVLVIVTVPDRVQEATANLLGPVVVNSRTRQARQVVLSDRWTTRHRLVSA